MWSGSCIPLAIFRAAVEDDVESLKAWQVAGADLNMEDYHRCTPLDMVCIPVCVRGRVCYSMCTSVLCIECGAYCPPIHTQAKQHNAKNSIHFLTQCAANHRYMLTQVSCLIIATDIRCVPNVLCSTCGYHGYSGVVPTNSTWLYILYLMCVLVIWVCTKVTCA